MVLNKLQTILLESVYLRESFEALNFETDVLRLFNVDPLTLLSGPFSLWAASVWVSGSAVQYIGLVAITAVTAPDRIFI